MPKVGHKQLVQVKVTGLEDLVKNIQNLEAKLRTKANREAAREGALVLRRAMKSLAPKRIVTGGINVAGTLRKAIRYRIRVYRTSGVVVAIIGVARKIKVQIGARKRQGKKSTPGDPVFEVPTKIYHFTEFGTARKAGQSYIRRAMHEQRAAARAAMEAAYRRYLP